jgi:NADH-quinone oxidoreductase subunit N
VTDGATLQRLIPEMVMVLGGAAVFLGGAFGVSSSLLTVAGRAIVLLAALFLAGPGRTVEVPSGGPIFDDPFGMALRWISVVSAIVFLFGGARARARDNLEGERVGSTLLVFAGCMLAALAADLSLLFVAMELVSIPTYCLIFLGRRHVASSEAAIKYFLLSIFSSAFLLYGLAWIYMLVGTTSLRAQGVPAGLMVMHGWSGMLPWSVLLVRRSSLRRSRCSFMLPMSTRERAT